MFAIIDIEGMLADTGGNQDVLITFNDGKGDGRRVISEGAVPLEQNTPILLLDLTLLVR